jgi:hypothetical protein
LAIPVDNELGVPHNIKLLEAFRKCNFQESPKGNKINYVVCPLPWGITHMNVMIMFYEEDHSNPTN